MDAFEAARRAAEAKGFKGTRVEDDRPPIYRRPGPIAAILLLLLIGVGVAYYGTRPIPPPAWTFYPRSREAAAREIMELIASGNDEQYSRAYARLDPTVRNPEDREERGQYRQIFHVIHQYSTGEFGDNWIATAKFAQDPANPEIVTVKVGAETLKVQTGLVTPPDAMDRGQPEHFAVRGIDDFGIAYAPGFQTTAARTNLIDAVVGPGSAQDLRTILGATRQNRHETPMQTKVRMLPILRNPRETNYRTVLQTYPVREDPVMRARLEMIRDDTRYDNQVREGAEQVLKKNVPEGALEGAGVID
jgi:hypothetical protein